MNPYNDLTPTSPNREGSWICTSEKSLARLGEGFRVRVIKVYELNRLGIYLLIGIF